MILNFRFKKIDAWPYFFSKVLYLIMKKGKIFWSSIKKNLYSDISHIIWAIKHGPYCWVTAFKGLYTINMNLPLTYPRLSFSVFSLKYPVQTWNVRVRGSTNIHRTNPIIITTLLCRVIDPTLVSIFSRFETFEEIWKKAGGFKYKL